MTLSDSHLVTLREFAGAVSILELGSGTMSTPMFLDRTFFPVLSRLVVVEDEPEWLAQVPTDARVEAHLVPSVAEFLADQPRAFWSFDLIFVDNSRTVAERVGAIRALSDIRPSGAIVIHDWDCPAYRLAAVFSSVTVHDAFRPWTAVCRS